MKRFSRGNRSGQVMMLTVLTLGGTILGATTIAGLLMLYQIRQGTDLSKSAKAIFAADAGIEWALYALVCSTDPAKTPCPVTPEPPKLDNGASVAVTCRDDAGTVVNDCNASSTVSIKSIGTFGETARAFCIFEDCAEPAPGS